MLFPTCSGTAYLHVVCVVCTWFQGIRKTVTDSQIRHVHMLSCGLSLREDPQLFLPLFLQIVFCSRSQASQPCLLLQRHEFVRTVAAQRLASVDTSGSSVWSQCSSNGPSVIPSWSSQHDAASLLESVRGLRLHSWQRLLCISWVALLSYIGSLPSIPCPCLLTKWTFFLRLFPVQMLLDLKWGDVPINPS